MILSVVFIRTVPKLINLSTSCFVLHTFVKIRCWMCTFTFQGWSWECTSYKIQKKYYFNSLYISSRTNRIQLIPPCHHSAQRKENGWKKKSSPKFFRIASNLVCVGEVQTQWNDFQQVSMKHIWISWNAFLDQLEAELPKYT